MAVQHATPRLANPSAVQGLEGGREYARRRATRRRAMNTIISGLMFLLVAGIIGGAGYYLWQFYADEQDRTLNDEPVVVEQRGTDDLIHDIEANPRWNGPGAPAFGVGDDQP